MTSSYTAQESIYKDIAVIGCGAAGGLVSVLALKNPYNKVTAFDTKSPFQTLLPTGGGRCNLSFMEDDFKTLVKNYPRGEKFLLSVFSRFGVAQTLKLFADLSVKTYVQPDNRVFPVSDSSKELIKELNSHLNTASFKHVKKNAVNIAAEADKFRIYTEDEQYLFDRVVIATGGRGGGYKLAQKLGHSVSELRPSLCALDIKEKYFYSLCGVSLKNVSAAIRIGNKKFPSCEGDMLFTDKSISGPCVFKISSLTAFEDISESDPITITLKFTDLTEYEIEEYLKQNSKKSVKNIFREYLPERFYVLLLQKSGIDAQKQCSQLTKKEKEILHKSLTALELHAAGRIKNSEIVTAGGVNTDEINPKTMESKIVKGLYFAGEILNIDGFTGGFNLQNCWSNAFLCASALN